MNIKTSIIKIEIIVKVLLLIVSQSVTAIQQSSAFGKETGGSGVVCGIIA